MKSSITILIMLLGVGCISQVRNSDFGVWLRTSGDDFILRVLVPIIAIWSIWVCREDIAEWWKNRGKTPEEIEADAVLTPEEMEIEFAKTIEKQTQAPWFWTWLFSCGGVVIMGLIALFIIGGIIGLALIGWDKLLELFN